MQYVNIQDHRYDLPDSSMSVTTKKILKKLIIILNRIQMFPFEKLSKFLKYQKQRYTEF